MTSQKLSATLVGEDAPVKKLPLGFEVMPICENSVLGLDLGIGSIGQAIIYRGTEFTRTIQGLPTYSCPIAFLGVRTFEVPEIREKAAIKLKNPERRQARLLRRSFARRAQRMREMRRLLVTEGVLPTDYDVNNRHWQQWHERNGGGQSGASNDADTLSPILQWRVLALEQRLEALEWAAVLLYLAKHRGFRSSRKSDLDTKGKAGGTLDSVRDNAEALKSYRTAGEMLARDPRFLERKRNREGSYTALVKRADLVDEVHHLFVAQRHLGNPHTSEEFHQRYLETLQKQRPLQDPYQLLDDCPFEPKHKRGSKQAPSFELCRALQKLNTLTLILPNANEQPFATYATSQPEGYTRLMADFGVRKSVSWADLRKYFAIPDTYRFKDLYTETKEQKTSKKNGDTPKPAKTQKQLEAEDFVNRSNQHSAAASTHFFRNLLGEHWQTVVQHGWEPLDEAAFALTFFEVFEDEASDKTILGRLRETCSQYPELIAAIQKGFEERDKTLISFKGSVATSALVSRKIIPFLAQGKVYSAAMEEAGYNHAAQKLSFKGISNPIVQSVVRETMKQVIHLIHEYGYIPGKIHVEIARDLGKSMQERGEISAGIAKRTKERNSHRELAASILGGSCSEEDLLKYELYKEQSNYCPYCGETLPAGKALFGELTQIDHILPRSRSQDNSYDNRVLVHTGCNQNKGNKTPYECFGPIDAQSWQDFDTRIRSLTSIRGRKRRNLLNTTFATDEKEFLERNLNDTRYISRLVAAYLQEIYTLIGELPAHQKGGKRRVFVRPGPMTALLRKAWGLEDLKKDLTGKRIGDKHHAVDALICACTDEAGSQFMTRLSQVWGDMENKHQNGLIPKKLEQPWPEFRDTVVAALNQLSVSRRENCSGKGSLHSETIYGRDDEGTGWKRTALIKVDGNNKTAILKSEADLERVRGARAIDVERNPFNQWFRDALAKWIRAEAPVDQPPLDKRGKAIMKVFVEEAANSFRKIPRGWVQKGDIVRCDVFSKAGQYAVVPVYTYHLNQGEPPMRFIKAHKREADWGIVDESYQFEFSLWKYSRFRVQARGKRDGQAVASVLGVYRGLDRSTAKISYSDPNDLGRDAERVSVVTAASFSKQCIDRLGRVFEVRKEKRTWRGKVCT